MDYIAHSAKDNVPPQSYEAHIKSVVDFSLYFANELRPYCSKDSGLFSAILEQAAQLHDLGKLFEENQIALSSKKAKSLPIHHQDAGAAYWLKKKQPIAGALIQAHHVGFSNFTEEANRGEKAWRDDEVSIITDEKLDSLLSKHNQFFEIPYSQKESFFPKGNFQVFLRMLLSCLADSDHTDTAINYCNYPKNQNIISLKPKERLCALDKYVVNLSGGIKSDRNDLRNKMYYSCRDFNCSEMICSCDSPVGSGKTTAIMAHLLNKAITLDLRRIFIVLPYTNIISQSVETYRKALVLEGEKSDEVVAELHCKADFESEDSRHFSSLWKAPIIVTTAVAFFETLASNTPSCLRKLHELPGSAIFIDESHASLPVHLLPLAWRWINVFANEWHCYWVLASGSLQRFWNIKKISDNVNVSIPEIVDTAIRNQLSLYEKSRVNHKWLLKPIDSEDLIYRVNQVKGPRLLILNTVQSAAVIAKKLKNIDKNSVEHLSTALTPKDREKTLERIKNRLRDLNDTDWTLVATSCVEAGMDFSFQNGFREIASLSSLLQASGRVNRNGKQINCEMWSFVLANEPMLKSNPSIENSSKILNDYLKRNIYPEQSICTEAMEEELILYGKDMQKMIKSENNRNFKEVEEQFCVIDSNTKTVVVYDEDIEKIKLGNYSWQDLQKNTVQINVFKLRNLKVPEIRKDIYQWNLLYDDFLGYMAGILKMEEFNNGDLIF